MSATQQLLRQTATRLWLGSVGRRWHLLMLILSGLALAFLASARLLGALSIGFLPWAVAPLPIAALLLALVLSRRPSDRETARTIDRQAGTKDLFLTTALIAQTPGEYRSIVETQAEERAGKLRAAELAPWRWQRGAAQAVLALALVLAALRWLPQLDPFHKVAERQKIERQKEQLQQSRQITVARAAAVTEQTQQQAAQVQQALAALDKTFKEIKPNEKETSLKKLAEEQRDLGDLWRKVNKPEVQQALEKGAQSFGRMDAQKLNEWREQLKKGDLSGVKRELAEMREEMKRLAEMPDSAEKRARQEKLAGQANRLAETMKQLLNSPQVNDALARAMAQLDATKRSELSKEGMQAAADSLQLSEKELEQIAQSMKDGQSLEDALKDLQMAKQLANAGKLDGDALKNANSITDYEAMFAEKMAEVRDGRGQGDSGMGPGIGNGARRPEDDSVKTGFKSEKSTTALTGGKMLLEWKTKEVGESGTRAEDFRDAVRDVKQGVSEAIQAEQVPPGYHEAIKKYFDTLPENKAAH